MKRLLVFSFFAAMLIPAFAQNDFGKADDAHRIFLQPVIYEKSGVPAANENALLNKLIQIATANGFSTDGSKSSFVITANIIRESDYVTATAPVMHAMNFGISLYLGDPVTGQLFSSVTLPSVKAVATNEVKAYQQAINSIRPDNPEITKFIGDGTKKIIEYYNSHIDLIISQADALVKLEKYDEAVAILFSVPDVCMEARDTAMKFCGNVFQTKIDREGAALLAQATYIWNSEPDENGAVKAVPVLSKIHPLSSSASGAMELSGRINAVMKEKGEKAETAAIPVILEQKAGISADSTMREITRDVAQQDMSSIDTANNNNWW